MSLKSGSGGRKHHQNWRGMTSLVATAQHLMVSIFRATHRPDIVKNSQPNTGVFGVGLALFSYMSRGGCALASNPR